MKKKIYKFLSLLLVFTFFFSLTSCSLFNFDETKSDIPSTTFIKNTDPVIDIPTTEDGGLSEEELQIKKEEMELKLQYEELVAQRDELKQQLKALEEKYQVKVSAIDELRQKIIELENEIEINFSNFTYLENVVLTSSLYIKHTSKRIENRTTIISTSQGSGSIIKEDGEYYYCLTNNHVIADEVLVSETSTSVYDFYGNEYKAEIIMASPSYDMAILKIQKKPNVSLNVIKFAKNNPVKDDIVISIGNPLGLINSIQYGKVVRYSSISSVAYDVICHSAIIKQGSSGGMLLNKNFEVIGINTWGLSSETESYGGASPVMQIYTFLDMVGIEVN